MRWVVMAVLLGCVVSARAGSRLETAHASVASGLGLIDLAVWGRTNGLAFSWERASRDVFLTNRSTRLAFSINSRQVEINGVRAWLSWPITPREQTVTVAALDVRTLLQPVLKPTRNRPGQKVRTVALDPGHGGKDKGFETGRLQEKNHTLMLARTLRSLLQQAGLKVVLTRATDAYVELEERTAIAKRQHADLFVSLHYNSAANGKQDAKGVEVYCMTPAGAQSTNAQGDENSPTRAALGNLTNAKSVMLAYHIQKAIVTSLRVEDRGVRRARFAVLRNAEMPAVLIEGGFMSAPDEGKQIAGRSRRDDLAQAILDGILSYKRLVERP